MNNLKNKKVLVIGAGASGIAALKLLHQERARVFITDANLQASQTKLATLQKDFDFEVISEEQAARTSFDLLVISPGVPASTEWIQNLKKQETPLIGELELAFQFIKEPVIAITGTNGKSTTTRLIHEFLLASGLKSWIGGNYGIPLCEYVAGNSKADVLVIEVSSFQLETIEYFSPDVIVMLNIGEDHLDRYSSISEYTQAKMRIFENTTSETFIVLNSDDPTVSEMATDPNVSESQVLTFSNSKKEANAHIEGNEIIIRREQETSRYDISAMRMKGVHATQNIMAALLACQPFKTQPDQIQKVIKDFPGLDHRLEFVTTKSGVNYFDDSKATNVHAVIGALQSFEKDVVLIAGGKDKACDYSDLSELVSKKVKHLILFGEAKDVIAQALGSVVTTSICGSLKETIEKAAQVATPGDTVLLSPACSSFDMFKDYKDRGDQFKALVHSLKD